eukprot:COSAG06_NODE_8044_length_2289_cov_1.948882_3_plen_221_part_00
MPSRSEAISHIFMLHIVCEKFHHARLCVVRILVVVRRARRECVNETRHWAQSRRVRTRSASAVRPLEQTRRLAGRHAPWRAPRCSLQTHLRPLPCPPGPRPVYEPCPPTRSCSLSRPYKNLSPPCRPGTCAHHAPTPSQPGAPCAPCPARVFPPPPTVGAAASGGLQSKCTSRLGRILSISCRVESRGRSCTASCVYLSSYVQRCHIGHARPSASECNVA